MINMIKEWVKKRILIKYSLKQDDGLICNLNYDFVEKQERVLIVYLPYERAAKDIFKETVHTNRQELIQVIHILISKNYVVDVCAYNDLNAVRQIRNVKYNVIFGLGQEFIKIINEHPEAKSVLYLTENPYSTSLKKETERIDYFYSRNRRKLQLNRTGVIYKNDDEKNVDAIIYMCEPKYIENINKPKMRVIPSAFVNQNFILKFDQKNKKNFLVLGTAGFVHKGNDLLYEVFSKNPDWNLFICGKSISSELLKLGYENRNKNIIDCGYIDINSIEFINLVNKCSFILLPSCSEGFSTAVATGMCHGLIPLISRGIGMDCLNEYCLYFDGFLIDDIENKIKEVLKMDLYYLNNLATKIYNFAINEFTINKFAERFEQAVDILF